MLPGGSGCRHGLHPIVTCRLQLTREQEDERVRRSLASRRRWCWRASAPSVVRIGRHGGRGRGVVIGDGLVATNADNIRGDETLVTFAGDRQEVATVAAIDIDGDLAVLRVDTAGAPP